MSVPCLMIAICFPVVTIVSTCVAIISAATAVIGAAPAIIVMITSLASAAAVSSVAIVGESNLATITATMAPIVSIVIAIIMRSALIVSGPRTTTTSRTPVIAIPVAEVPIAMTVIDIEMIEVIQARMPVVMAIVVMISVIRVTPVAVVIHM